MEGPATSSGNTPCGLANLRILAAKAGLVDFTTVLKDGLDGLDFGRLFDNDPKEGNLNAHVWQSNFIQPSDRILNALDDTWQREFEDAVGDWSESPALPLEAEKCRFGICSKQTVMGNCCCIVPCLIKGPFIKHRRWWRGRLVEVSCAAELMKNEDIITHHLPILLT